jgi:hypothetical protein
MQLPDLLTNRYTIAYAAALLLHILFLLLSPALRDILALSPLETTLQDESEPLTFEFVEAPDAPATEPAPEDARLASTRDAISRDASDADLPASAVPFSEGQTQARDAFETRPRVAPVPASPGAEEQGDRASEPAPEEAASQRETDFAAVLKRRARERTEPDERQGAFGRPVIPPSLQMKNLTSQALERGGLQLSTYDWEFGPYLAYLKERIGNNLFPPALFKDYGLIDGQTLLKFRIYRDGSLEGPNVLKYEGSPMLRETSVRAVELSADFRPLPEDFPDDYLEISALFDYVVIRNER